ncbi:MAG: hypothetical protein IKN30_07480 [Synergistaceae bacterium]|nr:hypothetical protein [Synergistaceae bacterium]
MNGAKIFFVKYPTGCIKAYVKNFFCTAQMTGINKLLRLAKDYSTEEHRIKLLSDLREITASTAAESKRIGQLIEKIKGQKWGS